MDIQSITESMTTRFLENLRIGQEPQQAFDQAFMVGGEIGDCASIATTELKRLRPVAYCKPNNFWQWQTIIPGVNCHGN